MEARPHEASSGSQRALPETIPAVFGAIAARFSHHSALEEDAAKLTYAELDRLSNRVANGLLAEEAQRPVAMVAPLRAMSVVVMLGAVKAGRVFVPLDTRDPPERIRRIRDQLDAILATEAGVAELLSDDDDDPELALDPVIRLSSTSRRARPANPRARSRATTSWSGRSSRTASPPMIGSHGSSRSRLRARYRPYSGRC